MMDVMLMGSASHFNPAITICFAIWQGFPWKKVPYYIFAQVFGSFMAALVVYGQYHQQIVEYSAAVTAKGLPLVFNGGPASIFCSFPSAGQSLGYLFMIEWFVDAYIVRSLARFPSFAPWVVHRG